MKRNWILAVTLLSLMSGAALQAADDGAALYKSKCAGCHGASGEGKPAAKAPALKGTSLDAGQISDRLLKGGAERAPHKKAMAGVTEAQAKVLADYVKSLH